MPSDGKTLHLPLPRSACNQSATHTPSSPCLHFSLHTPFGLHPGEEFIRGTPLHRALAEAPWGVSQFFCSHRVSAQETSTPGEGGGWRSLDYPSCPREGTRVRASATSVWPGICKNSGPWEEAGRNRAPQASRVVGAQAIRSTVSLVGEFDNLGGSSRTAVSWFCLRPEKERFAVCLSGHRRLDDP